MMSPHEHAYVAPRLYFVRELTTPGARRTTSTRWIGGELSIEIATTKSGVPDGVRVPAGVRVIQQRHLGPLREAVALVRSPDFAGERDCGEFSLRSEARVVFLAVRSGQREHVAIQLMRPDGTHLGRPLTIYGDELRALEQAIEDIDRGAP